MKRAERSKYTTSFNGLKIERRRISYEFKRLYLLFGVLSEIEMNDKLIQNKKVSGSFSLSSLSSRLRQATIATRPSHIELGTVTMDPSQLSLDIRDNDDKDEGEVEGGGGEVRRSEDMTTMSPMIQQHDLHNDNEITATDLTFL